MLKVLNIVDEYKDLILEAEKWIWENPQTGFKEFKTSKYLADAFTKMGYKLTFSEGITGFSTTIDTGREGPTVLVIAEMDSLINFNHPACDKTTGAVHNCGHHVQCAAILGLAATLKREEILSQLSGKVKLCLVPAEEGIEIGYRKDLINKGQLKFSSGKPEFFRRGFFDDVDIAMMIHAKITRDPKVKFIMTKGHNGVIRKQTTVYGKASHAGVTPDKGINALNAANLALLAVNSLRETFREKDYVRFHSIITKGGDAVNAVPEKVTIESYVRAASAIAMKKYNQDINRAISASCAAIGATAYIEDLSGAEPLTEDANLRQVAFEVFEQIDGKDCYVYDDDWMASSTDMGDMSTLFPTIHVYTTGCSGIIHGKDFAVDDPYVSCVNGTKAELGIVYSLLRDGAKRAKEIVNAYNPVFKSVEEYLEHKYSLNLNKTTVVYNEDGTVTLDYKN